MEPREVLKDRRPHCSEPFLKMGGSSGRRPLSPFQSEKGSQILTVKLCRTEHMRATLLSSLSL